MNLRALHDAEAFASEQARPGRVWTLLGHASDIPRENDWFRATLGGRSVFIQRFAGGLRGFENRCAHRSYPLRSADAGHGPILCGLRHWRYDAAGAATGIPNCRDAFGATPRELGRRLTRSLHVAGKYLRRYALTYQRFGPHSAYFTGPQSGTLGDWTARLRNGQPDGPGYRILHLFPNAGITLLPAVPFLGLRLPLRYIIVQRHVAVEPGRTRLEVRIITVPPAGHGLRAHLLATWQRLVAPLIQRGTLRVLREDQAVCENLQSIARQITPDALYGSAEERVAWFNAAYAAAMAVPVDERN